MSPDMEIARRCVQMRLMQDSERLVDIHSVHDISDQRSRRGKLAANAIERHSMQQQASAG